MDNEKLVNTIMEFLEFSKECNDCPFVIDINEKDLKSHDIIFIREWVDEVWSKDQL